ncbi:MAG: nucleoside kinase [Spirochaetales bacterium]
MSRITLHFSGNKTAEVIAGSVVRDFIDYFEQDAESVVAVRFNNEICSLSQKIEVSGFLEPVFLTDTDGSSVYRRTLCFVLAAAAHELFPDNHLIVGHSLGYSYYYTMDDATLTDDNLQQLQQKMAEIIDANLCINQTTLSYNDTVTLLDKLGLTDAKKQLHYRCKSQYIINNLRNFSDLYFGPLLPSTGKLTCFSLLKYGEGFLLQFPTTADPTTVAHFEDIPQLFNVYKRYKQWGKTLGVTSVVSLNEMIFNQTIKDFINITETLQNKCIADIADTIHNTPEIKVVLIAGPSSSGKTTTSKKLSMQLQVLGYKPNIIELDTYYVGREKTPKNEKGEYDYECLEALDVAQLNKDIIDLFNGKEINVPAYDFVDGKRYDSGKKMTLHKNDILILEGIHGLNDKLTALIPAKNKFKLYLSALTQLNLDNRNRIPTGDNRLIRRIVRDYRFRGKSASATIKMWENVHRGERLHIFPFQNNANVMLNTALDYELAVLKTYAEPLLRCVTPLEPEYAEASRLLRFLENFSALPAHFVPGQSLIREFIGGSEFKY